METLRTVWKTGRIEVSESEIFLSMSDRSKVFTFPLWSGCQISVSTSSIFSGKKALVVEGRTAKWAGPDAGNRVFVQF